MIDSSQFASLDLHSSPTRNRPDLVSKAVQHFDARFRSASLSQAMAETVDMAVRLGLTDEECQTVYGASDMPSGASDGFLKGVQRKRRIGMSPEKIAEWIGRQQGKRKRAFAPR